MVTVLPSTGDAVVLRALVGVGALVLVAAQEVGLWSTPCRDRPGSVLGVHRALDAEGDLLGGDRVAVLPLGVVADRERPLGEVVVGRAEVGGQVGHQDHLAGLVVAGVLGQRAVVSACWIELPVTDQPSVGSSVSGPGSPGR